MKRFGMISMSFLVLLLVAGCGGDDSETPSPESESACALECNIGAESYSFNLTCESGQVTRTLSDTTQLGYGSAGQVETIQVEVQQELTYEESGNTYQLQGTIAINNTTGRIAYDLTATGGAFGDKPQTCQSGDSTGTAENPPPAEQSDTGLIKGLFPDSIIAIMAEHNVPCDSAKINDNWYAWKCNLFEGSDWLGFVEFFSKSPTASVDQLEATALKPKNARAVELLSIAAAFPYTNAEPQNAKNWVELTLPALGAGNTEETTFGGVTFQLEKSEGTGMLSLNLNAP